MDGVIDIHGAGEFIAHGPLDDYGQQSNLGRVKGIPHCVIGRETAVRLEKNNVVAKPFASILKYCIKHVIDTFEVVDPFSPLSSRKTVSLCAA